MEAQNNTFQEKNLPPEKGNKEILETVPGKTAESGISGPEGGLFPASGGQAAEKKKETIKRAEKIGEKEPPVAGSISGAIIGGDAADDIVPVKEKEEEVLKDVGNLKKLPPEEQVDRLCKLAFIKGINYSVEVAVLLDEPDVLDGFHDQLIAKFYARLVQTGKIKKI